MGSGVFDRRGASIGFGPGGTLLHDVRFDQGSRQIDVAGLAFTRGSTADFLDYLGATITAESNELRIAGGRYVKQLLISSNGAFSGWTKDGAFTVSDSAGIAPDGSSTAARVMFTGASQALYQMSAVTSQPRIASIYVKPVLDSDAGKTLRQDHGGSTVHTLAAGWQRISRSTTNGTASSFSIGTYSSATIRDLLVWHPLLALGTVQQDYVSKGVLASPFDGLFVDGSASFATDLAGDVLSTVRGALLGNSDSLILTMGSWYNPDRGYLAVDFDLDNPAAASDTNGIIQLDDGTSNNRIVAFTSTATQTVSARADINGVTGTPITMPLPLAGEQSVAVGWSSSGLYLTAGSDVQAFSGVPIPVGLTRALIGKSGSDGLKGAVSRVRVYG